MTGSDPRCARHCAPTVIGPYSESASHHKKEMMSLKDGGLDSQIFLSLVTATSPIEEWVKTLPLNQLVADALSKSNSCLSTDSDQLRHLSRMSQDHVKASCNDIMKNLETILAEQLAVLRKAYDTLDSQAAAESGAFSEMLSMRVGNIDEFHQGLSA